jgi:hypothetical protein
MKFWIFYYINLKMSNLKNVWGFKSKMNIEEEDEMNKTNR